MNKKFKICTKNYKLIKLPLYFIRLTYQVLSHCTSLFVIVRLDDFSFLRAPVAIFCSSVLDSTLPPPLTIFSDFVFKSLPVLRWEFLTEVFEESSTSDTENELWTAWRATQESLASSNIRDITFGFGAPSSNSIDCAISSSSTADYKDKLWETQRKTQQFSL